MRERLKSEVSIDDWGRVPLRNTTGYEAVFQEIAVNWEEIAGERRNATKWVTTAWLHEMQYNEQAIHANSEWINDFSHRSISCPDQAIRDVIDFVSYELTLKDILDQVDEFGLVPTLKSKLKIDSTDYETRFYGAAPID